MEEISVAQWSVLLNRLTVAGLYEYGGATCETLSSEFAIVKQAKY
jgi:hypothetical protein